MRRREFVGLVGGAAVSAILRSRAAWSQDDRRMRRLGWLIARAETDPLEQAGRTVLREGLAKLGWIEGRNLRIEVRFAADNLNRLHTHAAELVNLVPDVIVSSSAVATKSLQQRTKDVPIVFVGGGDPAAVVWCRTLSDRRAIRPGFQVRNHRSRVSGWSYSRRLLPACGGSRSCSIQTWRRPPRSMCL